ncbi:hypothetical protein ACIBH1_11695 [Nonomuraea sp. NPDC050663]|uniref:prealbumin-like fold domain-containing protein n=1 Tax=Nonomuraea sp. NPDC050663 TaxID=3364370 RepID=UPI0037A0542D
MRVVLLTCLAIAAALTVIVSPSAGARAPASAYTVTLVARQCDDYSDIMANRARNNIQESLRDLGKDSVYAAGQPVRPAVEDANDPGCRPLNGWTFTFGALFGPQGPDGLTILRDTTTSARTTASTALLDDQGNPTGAQIAGAVTVTMSGENLDLAQRNSLKVQGGTPADTLNHADFGDLYGFGTLRCSNDNLNADNAESVRWPVGFTHVFCYYYTVEQPPEPATIVVRKTIDGPDDNVTFHYDSNVSYTSGGDFDLTPKSGQAGEITFQRGSTRPGDDPWTFTEDPLPGWELASLTCTSSSGESTVGTSGATATVTLAGGDTVTCTYDNRRSLSRPVSLYKQTVGAVGGPFAFTAVKPDGTVDDLGEISTTAELTPVLVGDFADRPLGVYTITETLPSDTPAGVWEIESATCNGQDVTGITTSVTDEGKQATVKFTLGTEALNCLVTNRFTPRGSITVEKITVGGTGVTDFVVDSTGLPRRELLRTVTTTEEGVGVTAEPLEGLPLGQYAIRDLPRPSDLGDWELEQVDCGGRTRAGTATVELTAERPNVKCTFTNRLKKYGGIIVSKRIIDPDGVRSGPVVVQLDCPGRSGLLSVPVGRDQGRFPGPVRIAPDADCDLSEPATGLKSADGTVTTTIQVTRNGTPGDLVEGTRLEGITAGYDDVVEVEVVDTYVARPVRPTPTPSRPTLPPVVAVPPDGGSAQLTGAGLPFTGFPLLVLGSTGLALVAGGVLVVWRRRTRAS